MKTKVYFLMLFVVSQLFIFTCIASANDGTSIVLKINDPNMFVNGSQTEVDPGKGTTPVIVDSRTLLPIRSVVESIYGAVYWNQEEQKITIKSAQNTIELWVDKTSSKVNDIEKTLDVAPKIINDRTMMPVRFIAETLDCIVDWDDKTSSVGILSLPGAAKDEYVANIGGNMIDKNLYNYYLTLEKSRIAYLAYMNGLSEESLWTGANGKTNWDLARNKALSDIKEHAIKVLKAKEAGISADTEEIKSNNERLDESFKGVSDDKVISKYGAPVAKLKDMTSDMLTINKYNEYQLGKIVTTDEETKEEYEKNRNDYDSVTVTHILFSTRDAEKKPFSAEKKAEVLKKAEDTLTKIKNGSDMKKLAKELSEDPGVKENEGVYSFVYSDGLVEEFKAWAFKASVNDLGIVETDFGYHVMKLDSRTNFDIAKDKVSALLINKKFNKMIDEAKDTVKYRIIINPKAYEVFKP